MTRKQENEAFSCINCGKDVLPLRYGTIRDHCPACIHSLHVDDLPGDRANDCAGLLEPVQVEHSGKKGYSIIYRCKRCGQKRKNRAAPDDYMDTLVKVQAKYAATCGPW